MILRNGTYKDSPYILERFESIDEFIETVESRPITKSYDGSSQAHKSRAESYDNRSWRGVSTYKEAKDAFLFGTKAKAEMSTAFRSQVDPRKRQTVNAPCGCAPIVAHALMGIPDSMVDIRRERIPKATKVVVNMAASCGISASAIIQAGKKLIAAVGKLESRGIATEIVCSSDVSINWSQLVSYGITIKNAGQAFNAARVSFSMSSPAFLRVFHFIHLSSLEGAQYDSGYGSPISVRLKGKDLSDYYETMYGRGIYMSLQDIVKYGQSEIDRAINEWQTRR